MMNERKISSIVIQCQMAIFEQTHFSNIIQTKHFIFTNICAYNKNQWKGGHVLEREQSVIYRRHLEEEREGEVIWQYYGLKFKIVMKVNKLEKKREWESSHKTVC